MFWNNFTKPLAGWEKGLFSWSKTNIETSEHAAKRYLSTLAVLQLDSILVGAKKVSSSKPKAGNKNQKPFERILNMEYELVGIGTVKMTVGVRRSTHEKVQYCITAIDNKE